MPGARRALSVVIALTAVNATLASDADEPLYVKNLSPVAGLLGLPSQRSAATTPAGGWSLALHGSLASHYINDRDDQEFVNLDGETGRLALDVRVGIAESWDVQLEIPWLQHSGGNLDRAIDNWHDFWGMSNGGRDEVERDLLDYRYAYRRPGDPSNIVSGFSLADDADGVGDISLALTHTFYSEGSSRVAAVAGYKFATGQDDDFTGSGADDVFVALRFSGAHLSDLPLYWHGQAGYLRAGDSDVLGESQQNDLWFAGISVDWQLAASWSIIAQVDGHRAPLDSGLTAIGKDAYLLTIGGRWRISPHWEVDVSIVEDIQVETAPDVTFQSSIRYRPRM